MICFIKYKILHKYINKNRSAAFKKQSKYICLYIKAWVCFFSFALCSLLCCFHDTLLTSSFCLSLSQHSADRKIIEGCEENQVLTGHKHGRGILLWKKTRREPILVGSQGFQVRSSFKKVIYPLSVFHSKGLRLFHSFASSSCRKPFCIDFFSGLSSLGCDVYPPFASQRSICPAGLWNRLYTYFNICEKTLSCRLKRWCNNRATADLHAAPPVAIFDLIWMGRLMGHSWNTARSLFRPISSPPH